MDTHRIKTIILAAVSLLFVTEFHPSFGADRLVGLDFRPDMSCYPGYNKPAVVKSGNGKLADVDMNDITPGDGTIIFMNNVCKEIPKSYPGGCFKECMLKQLAFHKVEDGFGATHAQIAPKDRMELTFAIGFFSNKSTESVTKLVNSVHSQCVKLNDAILKQKAACNSAPWDSLYNCVVKAMNVCPAKGK